MKTRNILALLMLFLAVNDVAAYDFEVDGIYYNKSGRVVYVTSKSSRTDPSYSGMVVVPASVTDEKGDTYRVEGIGSHAFDNCKDLASVVLPEGITVIEDFAFYSCKSLRTVRIPDTVESVGFGAFSQCTTLDKVILGSGIKTIGDEAFYKCPVTVLRSYASVPPEIEEYTFSTTCTLTVLPEAASAYSLSEYWSRFTVQGTLSKEIATALSFARNSMIFATGDEKKIIATLSPEGVMDELQWATSDARVATVGSDGVVTAVAPGTAVVTATTVDGSDITAKCKVTVYKPGIPGDVDGDGEITMNDANAIVNIFLNN